MYVYIPHIFQSVLNRDVYLSCSHIYYQYLWMGFQIDILCTNSTIVCGEVVVNTDVSKTGTCNITYKMAAATGRRLIGCSQRITYNNDK